MELTSRTTQVNSIAPVSAAAAVAGKWISLKNVLRCVVKVSLGVLDTSATVRIRQATAIAGTGAKNLLFSAVWRTGGRLAITARSAAFTVGETVTGGTSTATGVVHSQSEFGLVIYSVAGTFQDAETLTGGDSGSTATEDGVISDYGIKCRVAQTAAATATLTIPGEDYEIEIDPSDLDTDNDFDCINADISAVGAAAAHLVSIGYVLEQKYTGEPQMSPYID